MHPLGAALLAFALLFAACGDDSSSSPSPVSISVTTQPTKTAYAVGEAFSSDGIAVTATYSDASSALIPTGWTLSWNNAALAEGSTAITAEAGSKTVTVAYKDATVGFPITVTSTADTTPPGPVTDLAAAPGNGEVTLTWKDPADADLASIEITWTPGGDTPQILAKGTQTKTITGLNNGTPYLFTVKARDAAGNLNAGATKSATPTAPDTTPPAEVTLKPVINGQGQVVLSWTDPADADLASIEITWTPGGTTPVKVAKGAGKYTAVVANGAYTFTIRAVDTSGNKSDGVPVTAAPSAGGAADTTAPAEASGLKAAPKDGEVTLTWTDPADGDLASIEITWDNGGSTPQTVTKGTGTYTAAGLTNGTEHTFTVKAKDTAGNLSAGTEIQATPLAAAAQVTVNFTGPGDEDVALSVADNLSFAANTELTVSVTGSYTAYRWYVDFQDTGETGSSFTGHAGNLELKRHTLTVVVTKNGVEYSKRLTFTVTH